MLTIKAAAFLKEPREEFTAAIDAPLDHKVNSGLEAETIKDVAQ